MKKSVLRQYANLVVRTGANVQKGQVVNIQCDLDQPEFIQLLVEECYKAKASEVNVEWSYQPIRKANLRYRTLKSLGTLKDWEKAREEYYCDIVPVRIVVLSQDPDGLKGMNMAKMAKANQMLFPVVKGYRDRRHAMEQWCACAVPGEAWAKKVFPGVRASVAVEKLWEAILFAARVNDDPNKAWQEHNADLENRSAYLNSLHLRSLHYTADNGTDLTVGLIPEAKFMGGGDTSGNGIFYNPNIPTEECFTSPMRGQAEGIVYSTKPLSYHGQMIEDFSVRFEQGKAVEVHAKQGQEALERMISMDEGAAYLGECALVPQDSPIAESGLLFYNTLFDENAACHLALGMGFAFTIKDHNDRSLEECRELGINDSMIHVDFMIGCDSMNIDGTCEDGTVVPIFRGGKWAF